MNVKAGDRIELLSMPSDPQPIGFGEQGTVEFVSQLTFPQAWTQIGVAWDSGRSLMLCCPPDQFRKVSE